MVPRDQTATRTMVDVSVSKEFWAQNVPNVRMAKSSHRTDVCQVSYSSSERIREFEYISLLGLWLFKSMNNKNASKACARQSNATIRARIARSLTEFPNVCAMRSIAWVTTLKCAAKMVKHMRQRVTWWSSRAYDMSKSKWIIMANANKVTF